MKKLSSATLAILFAGSLLFAQSEKFTMAMKKNLAVMDSSFRNPADLLKLANNFERIATAEKSQWQPYYYAAYCQVMNGFMEQDKDKVDAIADKATDLIAAADSLMPGNSEISCIKSMIATCHIMVNPMQRWQEYGQKSTSYMEAAMKQDPSNPRPYYLKGQTLKNTPENFGGGCNTAKPALATAMEKFNAFKLTNEFNPNWGKEITQRLLASCK